MTAVQNQLLPTYRIAQTPYLEGKRRRYAITEVHHADEKARQKCLANTDVRHLHFESHAAALKRIAEWLECQRVAVMAELANIDFNTDQMNTLYPAPASLEQELRGVYDSLVAFLAQESATLQTRAFGPLTVQVRYMNTPNLVVFSLPEYDACVRTFSVEAKTLLLQALADAGLAPFDDWNGLGCTGMSVRVTAKQPVAA